MPVPTASPDSPATTVRIADLEPVASFIAAVSAVDAQFRSLTEDEFLLMPEEAQLATGHLRGALRALGTAK